MAAFGLPFFLERINTGLKERVMIEMIISGIVSGLMGYLLPQPKWATALQQLVWEWLKRKLSK